MQPWNKSDEGWTGVVLAGGQSSRMGRDKALIEVDGRTLLDRALDKLEPHVQELLVIGDPMKYGHVGPFVVADDIPGVGPLGGIVTAMRYASHDRLLVLACDMPHVTAALFDFLKQGLGTERNAFVPACDGHIEPLAAAYHRRCRPRFEAQIAQASWKVSDALEVVGATFVQVCPGENDWPVDLFRNINLPSDLQAMEVLLFGMLAEKAGKDRIEVQATSISTLRRSMAEHIPGLEQLDHIIAVDRVIVQDDRPLSGHEEVAILPPFAGG